MFALNTVFHEYSGHFWISTTRALDILSQKFLIGMAGNFVYRIIEPLISEWYSAELEVYWQKYVGKQSIAKSFILNGQIPTITDYKSTLVNKFVAMKIASLASVG